MTYFCFRPDDTYIGYLPLAHVLELSAGKYLYHIISFFFMPPYCLIFEENYVIVIPSFENKWSQLITAFHQRNESLILMLLHHWTDLYPNKLQVTLSCETVLLSYSVHTQQMEKNNISFQLSF